MRDTHKEKETLSHRPRAYFMPECRDICYKIMWQEKQRLRSMTQ